MKAVHIPKFLVAGILYVGLVFLVPGFWLLRHASIVLAEWLGWAHPGALLVLLHGAIYAGIYVGFHLFVRANQDYLRDDAQLPHWAETTLGLLSLRGYRWVNWLALPILVIAFLGLFRSGTPVVENVMVFLPVFLALLDTRVHLVPAHWEDSLPQPRFAVDSMPKVEPGTGRLLRLEWNPWLWSDPDRTPVVREFAVSEEDHTQAAAQPRSRDLAVYVTGGLCPSVAGVASALREISEVENFTQLQELGHVVALVRAIPYADDTETRGVEEYFDYPVELMWDGKGDCEDHAILAAAILDTLGHHVGLFHVDLGESGHVALAYQTTNADGAFSLMAADGREYFYVETVPTSATRALGDIAAEFFVKLESSKVILLRS